MKQSDITDFTNLYASFMRIKENPEQIDVQILVDAAEAVESDGEA